MNQADLYTPENDLLIAEVGSGIDLQLVDGIDQIRQEVVTRLSMYQGDWYLDTRAGIPYMDQVFVHNPDIDSILVLMTRQIEQIEGVIKVGTIEATLAGRQLLVGVSVLAEDGGTIVTVSIPEFIITF